MRGLHIPGLSLAVVRNGQIVKSRGYGVANLELYSPATPQTAYEIGSMTKQFTATAIMMLAEEQKLGLDDSITKYFPEAPVSWRPITIRHLLSHTSGIQNHVAVPGYLGAFKTNLLMESTPGRTELLSMFFKLPLEFQPGDVRYRCKNQPKKLKSETRALQMVPFFGCGTVWSVWIGQKISSLIRDDKSRYPSNAGYR